MIKGWDKFNESEVHFTEDMAMEIVFYFSEGSHPSEEIKSEFLSTPESRGILSFYESRYPAYLKASKKIYSTVNTGSLDFRDSMFKVYKMIREERSMFPLIVKIENTFIQLMDIGYDIKVETSKYEYKIILEKYDDSIDNFVKYTKYLNDRIQIFNKNPIKCTLSKAERLNGFYNKVEQGKDKFEFTSFVIVLRRIGWKLDSWKNVWSVEDSQ